MQRQAQAVWRGNLQQGQGHISNLSGTLKNVSYSFNTRFSDSPGTNPEELIAAAHASCFAMATSGGLSAKGFTPEELNVVATVMIEKSGDTWSVSSSHLNLHAHVPEITQTQLLEIVEVAKKNCPISRLLNTEITMEAHLTKTPARPWAAPSPN